MAWRHRPGSGTVAFIGAGEGQYGQESGDPWDAGRSGSVYRFRLSYTSSPVRCLFKGRVILRFLLHASRLNPVCSTCVTLTEQKTPNDGGVWQIKIQRQGENSQVAFEL
jgi:hypothetical protein